MTNRCVYDCKYCVNRRSNDAPPGHVHPGGAGGPHHPVLPPELHRGAVPLLRRVPHPGLHHGTDDPGAAASCGRSTASTATSTPRPSPARRRSWWSSWGSWRTGSASISSCRQRRALRTAGPGQDEAGHPGPHGADPGAAIQQSREELVKYRHAPRFAPAGQSTQMIVGATPDTRPAHPAPDPGAVSTATSSSGCSTPPMCRWWSSALLPAQGHQAAPAAGAPALSGGLAAAVLRLPGGGAAGCRPSGLRPPGGPQVQLGPPAPGLLPGGGQPGGL